MSDPSGPAWTCPASSAAQRRALPAEAIVEHKAEEAAEDERVGAEHPLQVVLREPEILLDRRERDVHDRDVEDHHELDDAQQRQRKPFSFGRM